MSKKSPPRDARILTVEPLLLMSANTIEGSDAAEWISGTDADDHIIARGGNDDIHAPVGNNIIDGGDGTDTLVIYEGVSSQYQIDQLADGRITLVGPGLNSPEIQYELINVERIAFNDGIANVADLLPTDPEPTDPEPTDPEPTDPEPTDPEPTDPEPTDPEPTDPEPTDPEPTDPEPTDPEPTDPEPTDPEPTDPEPTDPEPTDPGTDLPTATVSGTAGNDWLSGTDADDAIYALGGDDAIHAPVGNNFVHGGAGTDTLVVYEGIRSQYEIESFSNGIVRLTGPGLNAADISYDLFDVERISFNDGVVDITDLSAEPTEPDDPPSEPTDTSDPTTPDPDPTDPPSDPSSNTNATITGTAASEWLSGTDADDIIDAGDGNDAIHAPVGDNEIDGGAGTDTLVIYEGNQQQYQFTTLPDGRLQMTGPGINGDDITYTLRNIELISFNDGVVQVSTVTSSTPDSGDGSDSSGGSSDGSNSSDSDSGSDSGSQGSNNTDDGISDGNGNSADGNYLPPTAEQLPELATGAGISAFHRNGQTFLTWDELTTISGEDYHVYRHTEQITASNIEEAQQLTEKWGPLNEDTSRHQLSGAGTPSNFVITDLGDPLSDDTGLFVYTTQDGEAGDAFYAVTVVVDGVEQLLTSDGRSLTTSVTESVTETAPILVAAANEGHGLVFTHFMDYSEWNPTFQGYAYNYAVALPEDYDPGKDYSLKVELHAHGGEYKFVPETEFNWETIQLFVDDPGADRGTTHTWWFGFAADHNYLTDGATPDQGTIENYTQQRVLKAIDEVSDRFTVDDDRIHAQGNSMGASGALSLGLHYGDVFSGIYASQPMTNYAASPGFQSEFATLWGSQDSNLFVTNDGLESAPIQKYSAGQAEATGVYDWLNHGEQLIRRRGESVSFLMVGHGKQDNVIDWETQGQPFISALEAADVGYTAYDVGDLGHSWIGFVAAQHNLFSAGYGDLGDWAFENDVSYPAISNASNSSAVPTSSSGDSEYNLNIDWSTAWNPFHDVIVDEANEYQITIRSLDVNATADITPRNLQQFTAAPGDSFSWQAVDANSGTTLQSGSVVADSDGLVTLANAKIQTGSGTRFIITRN